MSPEEAQPAKSRVFYGWFALAGVALVIFIVGGALINSFGVLLPVVTGEFGWSRAEVSLALTLGILSFGLPSPLFGIFINRLGPRKTIIFGNALAALGLAGIYLAGEVWHFYGFYILVGLGGGFGGYIACTTLVNNWFVRRRSLALGIFQASAGLGGFIFPPLTTALIAAIDWRAAWLVLAGIILAVPVLIGGVFLIRNRPEDMGLTPDGNPPESLPEKQPMPAAEAKHSGWGVLKVMKTPTPWFIGGLAAANSFTIGMLATHQIAHVQDIGYEPMTAATTLSVMSVSSLFGSLLFGFLALRIKVRRLAFGAFISQLAGLTILLTAKELGLLYFFAVLVGLSGGALTTTLPTLVGSYYPRERYAEVLGMVFPFQIIANAAAGTIAGAIFDATDSYTPAFIAAAVLSLAGLCFAVLARPPKTA